MKRIVKLSTPWNHNLLKRTPNGSGVFGNYQFEIDNNCRECDYWIVWGGLKEETNVKCPPQNVIYVTDESHAERAFEKDFLNQFATVIACRKDLHHPRIIHTHDLGMWHLDKSYEEILALDIQKKSKLISVVSSDLTELPGHKKRFAHVNQLMGHFKDRMDYFGRGINPIEDKFVALADYQYSVAIENSFIKGYFTEKIFECFLTNTLPFYYGCPDLENYFDDRSFIRIDVNDYKTALNTIEDVIKEDVYRERVPFLREAAKLYLNKYYFFPAIVNIIESDPVLRETKTRSSHVILPEANFGLPAELYKQQRAVESEYRRSLFEGKQGIQVSASILLKALKFKLRNMFGLK